MKSEDFIKQYNIKLNNQQLSAVMRDNGQTLLLAVPGSGKTTVIVARTGYLIHCKKINPSSVLTVTYSKAAATDMKERYRKVFNDKYTDLLTFKTIHSLCYEIIRFYTYQKKSRGFDVIDDTTVSRIIRELYKAQSTEFLAESQLGDIKTKLTYSINMMLDEEEIKNFNDDIDFLDIFKKYQQYKIDNKIMDFDDQLKYAYNILKAFPPILSYYQEKYRYISVDEAQDTSKIQHLIIQLLADRYKNIFMVGDEDQTIYGFRAAFPKALLDFKKIYKDGVILKMEQNYRSTQTIVSSANSFIKYNKNRYDKNMITDNQKGAEIKHTILEDYNRQYNYLAKVLSDVKKQTAVIYRNNESAIPLMDLLDKMGVSYNAKEKQGNFFSHFVVKDIMCFTMLSLDPYDINAFEQIYYKVNCNINKSEMETLKKRYNGKKPVLEFLSETGITEYKRKKILSLIINFKAVRELNTFSSIYKFLYSMGYNRYLEGYNKDSKDKFSVTHTFTTKINTLLSLANQNPQKQEFLTELQRLSEKKDFAEQTSDIILTTIHSSKGLEFDKVIFFDIVDGIFPSFKKSELKNLSPEEMKIAEEDRRLFYVAVTRAKKELEIVSYKKAFSSPVSVSYFTNEFLGKSDEKKISDKPNIYKVSKNTSIPEDIKCGTKIHHTTYGDGIIISHKDEIFTIKFNKETIRRFNLAISIKNNIITIQ